MLVPIDNLSDPRVALYRNLKDRELAREGGLFIAEGEHVVRRLLDSDYPVHSVLLARRQVDTIAPLVPLDVPVYGASDDVVNAVIGFKFHSGIMAIGRRKTDLRVEDVVTRLPGDQPWTLLVCPEVINHDNMGSLIRIAAGFGASAMIVGEHSCDPFWRRSVRVSMGAVFRLPLVRSDDLLRDLTLLRESYGVELIATVLDADAAPLEGVRRPTSPDRVGILLGSESQGLRPAEVAACSRRVTIPMHPAADSLNVSVAAAVFLYHFTRTPDR